LASILEGNRSILESGATMVIIPTAPPVPLSIEYTADLRPLASETKGFLWQFGVSSGEEDFSAQFEQELLVREADQGYWMPLQTPDDPPFRDLAPGHRATAYVRLLGSLQTEHGLRVIFIVTEIPQ